MANTLKFGNGEWYGKKDTILAYNDENSNYKPLPFDFSRASKATVINKDGLIETVGSGIPRIDFLGNTKGALLLEPQRTNLITYSEDFSNAYWTKSGVSVTSGFTSPDGTTNAFKLIASSSNTAVAHNTYSGAVSITSGNTYTQNLFFKYDNHQYIKLQYGATGTGGLTGNQNVVKLDILNKTIIQPDSPSVATITEFSNNWVMVTLTATMAATGNVSTEVVLSNSNWDNASIKVGGESVYIYGAQLEEQSYPTSYIPTSGATATRTADVCNNAGTSATFNSTEGVLFAEIAALANDGTYRMISLSDGTATNRISFFYQNSPINTIAVESAGSGTNLGIYGQSLTITNSNKIAVKYKANDCALWVNGVEVATDTSFAAFSSGTFTKLSFDRGDGLMDFYGKTKQLMVFNEALSDSELATLTTL